MYTQIHKGAATLSVVQVWFNILLKNKLTEISFNATKDKIIHIINIVYQQGLQSLCSWQSKCTNIYLSDKRRKPSFPSEICCFFQLQKDLQNGYLYMFTFHTRAL